MVSKRLIECSIIRNLSTNERTREDNNDFIKEIGLCSPSLIYDVAGIVKKHNDRGFVDLLARYHWSKYHV